MEPDFVQQQIGLVLTDVGADAIKIGMLHSAEIIEAVASSLERFGRQIPVVLDPVMIAKGGAALLEPEARQALVERLVPMASVLTPNAPEASALGGVAVEQEAHLSSAAERLLMLGPGAVLLKGGHLDSDPVVDLLQTADGERHRFESPRIASKNTHGTGCTLASALASGVAQGLTLKDAVSRARDYVAAAIRTAPGYGKGHGPLNHCCLWEEPTGRGGASGSAA